MSMKSEIEKLKQRVYYLEGECQRLAGIISHFTTAKEWSKEMQDDYHYPPPKILGYPQTPQWRIPEPPSSSPNSPTVQC